jgi:dihydrofolate synthase/folylpolyglutamate synthase
VAVIEAGLGGRYDATNVIPSSVQVLTNVGLEHTRWLGPTIADIAKEKLAVVRGGATLVVGALEAEAEAEAEKVVARQWARLVHAPQDPGVALAALGGFQRRNFAVAKAAAEAFMGPLDAAAVEAAAASVLVPGRLQPVAEDPLTLLDGAHNPSGLQALAESLPDVVADRSGPLVAVVSILEDKDAAAMLRELLPHVDAVVFTRSVNPRALSPGTLESLWRQLGGAEAEIEADARRAVERARERAGAGGSVLVTGSIYLVADLLREPGARRASMM